MANTVVGFFDSASEAQSAVEQLVQDGFSRENIDVSSGSSDSSSGSSYSDGSSTNSDGSGMNTSSDTHRDSDHDSGNAVTRFFRNLFGGNDDEATRYSTVAQKSGAMVTVHADSDDEAERAADLLDDYGAVNVDEKASEYGYASAPMSDTTSAGTADNSAMTYTDEAYDQVRGMSSDGKDHSTSYDNTTSDENIDTSDTNREGVIPIVQESLEVGKRTVETGGVRVRSRIVQRPVEESIRLREEKVTVERTPVNRVVNAGDMGTFQEQNIELTETAEVPVVHKEARVVEEVRVTKDVNERDETIHDTVRNTEVDVENLEGKSTTNTSGYSSTTGTTGTNTNTSTTGV